MLREGNVDSKWRVTAVGPTIIPWECRGRTFERLITAPVSLTTVLLGDFQASLYFGLGVSLAVSVPAVLYLGINPSLPVFIGATLLALACFSAMTILMSSYPPKDVPADVMMLSSLVKFSLLFISGIFVPIERLPSYGRALSFVSPLTYYVDAVRHSLGGGYLPVWLDLVMLAIFAVAFFMAGAWVHEKVLERRFT
nr:ABC transporter permease [Thermococcus stetteri]